MLQVYELLNLKFTTFVSASQYIVQLISETKRDAGEVR